MVAFRLGRAVAWAIAKEIMDQGGKCGFTHLPDKPDDEKKKSRRRVSQLTDLYPTQAPFLEPMDVNKDDNIAAIVERARVEFGQIDRRHPAGMTLSTGAGRSGARRPPPTG